MPAQAHARDDTADTLPRKLLSDISLVVEVEADEEVRRPSAT